MNRLTTSGRLARAALALLTLVLPANVGSAQEGIQPLPPDEKAFGLTLGEWSAAWWQWVLSIPASSNPKEDATGRFSAVGQRAPVWFLPHSPETGGSTTRSMLIPAGRALLFPVTTSAAFDLNTGAKEAGLRAGVKQIEDKLTLMEASVDGASLTDLPRYHVLSPLFNAILPPGNVAGFQVSGGSGRRVRAVSGGHWIFLAPLPVGEHVIKVRLDYSDGWKADLTYNITVRNP